MTDKNDSTQESSRAAERALRAKAFNVTRLDSHTLRVDASPNGAKCDFCGAGPVVGQFMATDTLIVLPPSFGRGTFLEGSDHLSAGPWAACEACRALVTARDREGLVNRAIAVLFANPAFGGVLPSAEHECRAFVAAAHDAFWRGHAETQ